MTPLVSWLVYAVEYDCQIFSKYLVFQIEGVKNPVFQHFWFEISSISIEIQGFDRNTRYFDWNTRLFIWNTTYFKNVWMT